VSLPVDLRCDAPRLAPQVETTGYFNVAEALTNVVKHSRAARVGGADPGSGTGLTGLLDRTEASNGSLTVTSGPGQGTTVRATLPLAPAPGS
jgi:signal transduction histidine kinase